MSDPIDNLIVSLAATRAAATRERADERKEIAQLLISWCDDPLIRDRVHTRAVDAVRALAYSVREGSLRAFYPAACVPPGPEGEASEESGVVEVSNGE